MSRRYQEGVVKRVLRGCQKYVKSFERVSRVVQRREDVKNMSRVVKRVSRVVKRVSRVVKGCQRVVKRVPSGRQAHVKKGAGEGGGMGRPEGA